jgi:hypothetical protein
MDIDPKSRAVSSSGFGNVGGEEVNERGKIAITAEDGSDGMGFCRPGEEGCEDCG